MCARRGGGIGGRYTTKSGCIAVWRIGRRQFAVIGVIRFDNGAVLSGLGGVIETDGLDWGELRERFEELVLLSPLEKQGYCFFPDGEAATDAAAVSFLYSALA